MNTEQGKALRVLLADDHPIVMTGFSMSLAQFGIVVVGEAKTPTEVMELFRSQRPDVVILDMRFGEKKTGLEVAKDILAEDAAAKIIFLSQFDQDFLIKETYRIGGYAYLTKDCLPEELAAAVAKAASGTAYFLPQIAQKLANLSIHDNENPEAILNAREMEIFVMMARGVTNAEMAQKLNLSLKTISNECNAIKQKLNLSRSADLTLLAVKRGYIEA